MLDQRVQAYLSDKRTFDHPLMYGKAVLFISLVGVSYAWLVFWSQSVAEAGVAGLALALSIAAVGFNVQHDANHGSFSRSRTINAVLGFTLDLLGASSYFWADKHNHNHHVFTNVSDQDADLQAGILVRFSADHEWRWFHRHQHLYLWVLYCAIHYRYLYSDFQRLWFGKADGLSAPYPRPRQIAALLTGKAFFLVCAFVIPLQSHTAGQVVAGYLFVVGLVGLISGLVFQSAHSVDNVDHLMADEPLDRHEWVVHQIRTTSNFAPGNPVLTFLLGGLNFQREHHLFPKVSHIHYPALSRIVKDVCAAHGVVCAEHATFGAAIRSHYRFIREMGEGPAVAVPASSNLRAG